MEQEYVFDSTGGCARCDAIGGVHEEKPDRPHPNCDCEIFARTVGGMSGECFDVTVETGNGYNISIPHVDPPLELTYQCIFKYYINCLDEEVSYEGTLMYEGSITVDERPDDHGVALLEELMDEYTPDAIDDAYAIAEDKCICEEEEDLVS